METSSVITEPRSGVSERSRHPPADRSRRRAGWTCIGGGGLVVLFWGLYLAGPLAPAREAVVIRSFESAFPVADGVLAVTLFGAGVALLRGSSHAAFLLTAAGAMCVYLGLLDATFYGLRVFGLPLTSSGVVTLLVPGLCITGGAWALRRGHGLWRAR